MGLVRDVPAERGELPRPELPDRLQPIGSVTQRGTTQPAEPRAAVVGAAGLVEKSTGPEQAEVPADRGTAHSERARELRGVAWPFGEQDDEPPSGRIPEEIEYRGVARQGRIKI